MGKLRKMEEKEEEEEEEEEDEDEDVDDWVVQISKNIAI